jgi:FlaG/FlaF family flagellin (archaellin)
MMENRILKDQEAISQVFAILIVIAMVVTLAAITAGFMFGIDTEIKGPTLSVLVMNGRETPGIIDMKIMHAGGETIKAGDWKLSIVKTGDKPVFQTASTDFRVGDQIITTNLTDGTGNYTITNCSVYATGSAGRFEAGTKYNVQIIIHPFKTLTVDAVVILR